ncbi:MAG: beta-galactosidase, partial [Clostridia bacterium]|nr:beta-galactosidase [Clostridia bacterium]
FNCYSMDPWDSIENFSKITGKPVIIGEFHFGALDRGMDATGLRGVESQTERGVAYRRYMHRAAAHPMCLGAHYFILYDQAYLGRFDGENYQIGALDVCSRPYTEFIDGIVKTHGELYKVADGQMPPTEEKAKEIEAIAF